MAPTGTCWEGSAEQEENILSIHAETEVDNMNLSADGSSANVSSIQCKTLS